MIDATSKAPQIAVTKTKKDQIHKTDDKLLLLKKTENFFVRVTK